MSSTQQPHSNQQELPLPTQGLLSTSATELCPTVGIYTNTRLPFPFLYLPPVSKSESNSLTPSLFLLPFIAQVQYV